MAAGIERIDFHGLPALRLSTAADASAVLSLYGGQLLSWVPARGRERLYLSERARFGNGPVRGGVPVCFPQFAAQGTLPRHGFARTSVWTVAEQRTGDDFALATLRLADDPQSLALWPHPFTLELTVAIDGGRLDLELEVINSGHTPFAFTSALHTYLRVAELEECRLQGLHGFEYRDALGAGEGLRRDSGDVLLFDGPIDRHYRNVERPLLLRDDGGALGIDAEGFPDVVVWNPWEDGNARIDDMAPRDFRRMLCIEAAAIHRRIALDPSETWHGRQTLVCL
ncbi:D-hexose-6-phosphate mutarotase [Thauera linaloolentis]|uniref:Putative glucose-6-phosphate 1-epimerase n=1 Tax=Thauera linaloolentis (strain DSM 12138 / JCM 21573 / CCUG 41526 / CIP 105981 / IAM 15112 / NBRC 102519 / 47Lol) TaxID=1123367 RepID=N6Y5R9_THAL4|nr:D-hexose-6-phosphate mutarotase [Thauera linaloolentis]ENO86915.1 aldose 1-epimerase [Thauera linaloolentis 47Lol = DSM 12138]MCM8566658.1 D-hexose-6-phosphate mutarotase [Thauera linaloolentis]